MPDCKMSAAFIPRIGNFDQFFSPPGGAGAREFRVRPAVCECEPGRGPARHRGARLDSRAGSSDEGAAGRA